MSSFWHNKTVKFKFCNCKKVVKLQWKEKKCKYSKFKVETKSIIGNDTSASTGDKTSTIK